MDAVVTVFLFDKWMLSATLLFRFETLAEQADKNPAKLNTNKLLVSFKIHLLDFGATLNCTFPWACAPAGSRTVTEMESIPANPAFGV